jgi:hypothetical protein
MFALQLLKSISIHKFTKNTQAYAAHGCDYVSLVQPRLQATYGCALSAHSRLPQRLHNLLSPS